MSSELSVDEMIVATINSSKGLDERVRNQMIAWIKCATDFGNNIDELAEQNRNLLKENEAFRLSENEAVEIFSDLKHRLSEVEKEKCELLGIIQQKDKLIDKMKCCDNCKHRLKVLEMEVLDLDKDDLQEPCNVCNNYDKWEIRQ